MFCIIDGEKTRWLSRYLARSWSYAPVVVRLRGGCEIAEYGFIGSCNGLQACGLRKGCALRNYLRLAGIGRCKNAGLVRSALLVAPQKTRYDIQKRPCLASPFGKGSATPLSKNWPAFPKNRYTVGGDCPS
jgi:hypothetical protein